MKIMAAKKRSGSVANLTVEILKSIRDEVRNTNTRLDQTNVRLDQTLERLDRLTTDMNTQFERVDARLEGIDGRLGGIDGRLGGIDGRLEGIDGRLGGIDGRLDRIDGRLETHGKAIVKLIGQVESLNGRFDNFLTGAHKEAHEELRARVERIEQRLDRTG